MATTRERYLVFIDRHEAAWELSFAVLAVVFVVVGFTEESTMITIVEAVLTLVFVLEFTTRIGASRDRRA